VNLKDKVVVVTGASSGIGLMVSQLLAEKGAKLALLSRSIDKLNALASEMQKNNQDAAPIRVDVTDRESVKNAIKQAVARFGRIDILINCAGVGHYGAIETLDMKEFEDIIRTNIFGVIYMIQESMQYLKASNGMIVNISSGLSKRGLPYLSAYGSTKAMLNQISEGLRVELMGDGVKVLAYNPPATDTPFIKFKRPGMKLEKVTDVAPHIVKAIEQEKREVTYGSGFLAFMNFFAPKALDNMFYKAMVKKKP
jgi:short-subunit dehydrogenase